MGSDASDGGNSVQAHESGGNDQANCQGQRDEEKQGRGSGTVVVSGDGRHPGHGLVDGAYVYVAFTK